MTPAILIAYDTVHDRQNCRSRSAEYALKSNLDLFLASSVKIKRHIKIRSDANPFDPAYIDYFEKRNKRNKISPRDVGPDERYLPIFVTTHAHHVLISPASAI
jgi:hypothetical protein